MKNSVLCLFSGGIDSTVMVKHYLDKDWDVRVLFVRHNQPRVEEEWASYYELCSRWGLTHFGINTNGFTYDGFYGPMRNAFLLAIGINIAYELRVKNIAIGLCQGEYLDTRPEFIDRFNFMQEYCLKKPIWVLAPFSNWSGERVIKYGLKIGAPLDLTTSCMETPACGKCLKCKLRLKWGIEDETPTGFLEQRIVDNPIVPY